MSSLQQQEKKEMTKLFHIKIQVKKMKVDALFDSISQENVIGTKLVKKLGLEVCDHPNTYPLGWVNKDAQLKVKKQCKIIFATNSDFVDEVYLDLVPLDVHGIMFGIPYMYMHDAIFMTRSNQYQLVKDGKSLITYVQKGK